ncbi:hypothetical protein CL614_03370 [archaeon]|nr:hypothetical protein [archaeon]|tara:strand:- start:711 stop:983 length:273 start_codon:yes stop_codon:yes gene_type:complete
MRLVTRHYTPVNGKDRSDIMADERLVKQGIGIAFRKIDSVVDSDENGVSIEYFLYACTEVPEIDKKLDEIMDELGYVRFELCTSRTCLRT